MPRSSFIAGAWHPATLGALAAVVAVTSCSRESQHHEAESSSSRPQVYGAKVLGAPTQVGLRLAPTTQGSAQAVRCSICHGPGAAGSLAPPPGATRVVHAGVVLQHGNLQCFACHDQADRDRLHLADGRQLPVSAAMELCSQCHGAQKRDYDAGAHGGMTGYWDLSRGSRQRNHCLLCHGAHSPAYPQVTPAPGPRDRGRPPKGAP